MAGKVFLVGAGPGDPGLLTLRGARLIGEADVIVMDALVSPQLVRGVRARVIDAGKRGPARENERAHGPSQSTINRLLIRFARAGKTVVRLKGGDPFIFGRGSEEIEALRSARIPFEVVPGVTSASAVPAYAGIPVTDRRWASQVTFVTGHERPGKESSIDWARVSPKGTLVVLMGVRSWPALSRELLAHGWTPSVPVAAIERGATPHQRVILSSLRDSARAFAAKKLSAPAVVVVGRVAALSRSLDWVGKERPLFGKRIVVTRTADSSDRLTALLEAEGADTISCPLIRVRPLSSASLDTLRLASSAARVPYHWLIFLSANAVRIFQSLWPDASRDLSHVPVAAIGPQTAQAATAAGWRVRKTPAVFTSEAVRRSLGSLRHKRVLLPRARIAPADVVRAFEKAGARVDVLPIYETEFLRPQAAARAEIARGADALTFLSASSVDAFAAAFPASVRRRLLRNAPIFSIGSMTSAAVRRWLGARPIQSTVSTSEGVVDQLRRYFASK
jgi:uroporphyrinogen III methyltransferase/synthase